MPGDSASERLNWNQKSQHEQEELRLNMMKKQVECTEEEDEEVSSTSQLPLFMHSSESVGRQWGCLLLIKHEKK